MDSNEAAGELVACMAWNLWGYEPFVEGTTGLIVGAECNTQTSPSGVPAIGMACVEPIAMNYAMFVNSIAINAVKTTYIHSWRYKEITRVDPAQSISDPPHAYISVVNDSFQQLFSSLTLCITLLQILLAPLHQWYTTASPQSTIYR
jgi:hypothetical protein